MTLNEQIKHVSKLREHYEQLAQEADDAELAYKQAQDELWEHMDAIGMSSAKIDGTRYEKRATIYGTVNDKQEFLKWAEENAPELAAPAPRMGLVNERVRQMLDNGEELPPGLNFYVKRYVAQTKQ